MPEAEREEACSELRAVAEDPEVGVRARALLGALSA
jgi:hypothetical protein